MNARPSSRWAKWFPGAWTIAPAKAPVARTRVLLAAAALLLLAALVSIALAAGAFRRPAFVLQGVVPLPVSSDAVFASASDDALWATVGDAVLTIDPRTGTSTRFAVPNPGPTLTGALGTPDSMWVADYYGNRVVRLDRSTGAFIGDVLVAEPGGLQWQDGLWVQDGGGGGVVRIAPTGDVDLRLPEAISYVVTPGALWYVDEVLRQGLGCRGGPEPGRSAGGSLSPPMPRSSSPLTPRAIHGSSLVSWGRTPPGS